MNVPGKIKKKKLKKNKPHKLDKCNLKFKICGATIDPDNITFDIMISKRGYEFIYKEGK